MAHLNTSNVNVDAVRHRSARAVEYYKKQVLPIYKGKNDCSPFENQPRYGSSDNLNGVHNSNADMNRTGHQEPERRVGFSNNTKSKDDSPPKSGEGYLTRGGHRATIHGTGSQAAKSWSRNGKNKSSSKEKKSPSNGSENKTPPKRFSRGLYRSNSNLEMDSIEYIDVDDLHNRSMHRDYGSTSSLDMLGNTGNGESFFDLLKDYRDINLDQRSPAPAKLQELLRGGFERSRGRTDLHRSNVDKVSNGNVPVDKSGGDDVDSPRSKSKFKHKDRKSRAKSITADTRPGLFTKFRGKPDVDPGAKTPENIDIDLRAEERLRSKAFCHYDCQSIAFDVEDVIRLQKQSLTSKKTSGASAASAADRNSFVGDKEDPDVLGDEDVGDNRSNGLVLSCPFFRNELGGEDERTISLSRTTAQKSSSSLSNNVSQSAINLPTRSPACCGLSILDSAPTPTKLILPHVVLHRGRVIEYVDRGASFYRHFFYGYDHQNYFGIDENLGPVAVSVRKEKVEDRENRLGKADYGQNLFRVIFRTSELTTLRGSVLEDAIPLSGSRLSSSRGVPIKDVLDFILPELNSTCLKQGLSSQKTSEQLLKLDEQGLNKTYKVGVMYCKADQSTEEEMYNNEHAGPAFEEFLNCIGQKVKLKGFEKYRAQLDNKTDSTGTHSVYASFNNCEIMFHISTMLPYTSTNRQQLLRKRHIGNDIVTIVFQEPGALPFTPKTVRSQFQHVFIIIRVHNPCSEHTHYSVAVSRSKDIPSFGPHIPDNAFFPKSPDFADFLLAKVINAENAAHKSEKFRTMATRTRTEYLKDLAVNHITSNSLDAGSKLSKFGLGSVKKKEKPKQKVIPDMFSTGALIWNVQVEDFGQSAQVDAVLGISEEVLVIIEESSKDVIFTVHCGAIIGWTSQATSIKVYYNQGESILLKVQSGEMEDMREICTRLSAVSDGCETVDMTLRRNGLGQLGFHIQTEGIVTDVENHGFAWEAGLRKGSRLVEICKISTATLTHEGMVDLLRTSVTVKVVVIQPLEDGNARGVATLHTNCHYSSLTTLNAAMQANELTAHKDIPASLRNSSESLLRNSSEYQPRKSTNSDELMSSLTELRTERLCGSLDRLNLKSEDTKVVSTAIDQFNHHREVSKTSSNSSEHLYHLREMTLSTEAKEQSYHTTRTDSHPSSDSIDHGLGSPAMKEFSRSAYQNHQRGSLTLPLQKKTSTGSRGDLRPSPLKGLSPNYREFRQDTGSLTRGFGLHHAFTDPSLSSSMMSSTVDDGYSSSRLGSDLGLPNDIRHERQGSGDIRHDRSGSGDLIRHDRSGSGDLIRHDRSGSGDLIRHDRTGSSDLIRHDRVGSKDSTDYALVGGGAPANNNNNNNRQWNTRGNQIGPRGWHDSNSSGDSSTYSSYIHNSESAPNVTSLQQSSSSQASSYLPPRKSSAPTDIGQAVAAVQHGNIALELLKQSQNSKFLLSQSHSADSSRSGLNSVNSSVNLSDTSFSSGSSHNSGGHNLVQRSHAEQVLINKAMEDSQFSAISRKRADSAVTNSKGRTGNLSGMSSEESLNTRLRPGVTTKPPKVQSPNNLQEELMRLIDPDVSDTELRGYVLKATEKPKTAKLKRTMSEESLHSLRGSTMSMSVDNNLADVIFTSTTNRQDKSRRLSPGTILDNLSRVRGAHSGETTTADGVPLPESTSGLEWSSLVNVAIKAIEGADPSIGSDAKSSKPKVSPSVDNKKETMATKTATEVKKTWSAAAGPTSYSSSPSVWRSVVANPQARIQELESKMAQLECDLDKERKENAALEAEVQELRIENTRLQEESQTAAAQLRKFTEWFFTTIDRQ